MIKLNLRWLIQAAALILGIASFTRVFNCSKALLTNFSSAALIPFLGWMVLFFFSFFLLMFTSYLKQRSNFTLRHRLTLFEKLLRALHLENYKEREGISDARQRKQKQGQAS